MSLHKICKSVDMSSQEWRSYCLWRKHDFMSFDSLDSSMHNMKDDNHVIGSCLFTVYDSIAQGAAADRHAPHNPNLNHDAQARRQD